MKKVLVCACVLALAASMTTAAFAAGAERQRGQAGPGDPWAEVSGTIVMDPSFEAGTPNPVWDEESTNFGTPLCDELGCGLGGGTGPRTGAWWSWFGGVPAFEEGAVSQVVTIPAGDSATLTFWTQLPACSGDAADFMRVTVDGVQVFEILGDDASCTNQEYVQRTIDISSAAGSTVDLEFRSVTSGAGDTMNFFVDDVEITTGGGGNFTFDITGVCPGSTTLTASGGTPGGNVGIIFSNSMGSDPLGGGPCAGAETGLTNPQLFTIVPLDGGGGFSFARNAPAQVCGRFVQLVDPAAGCAFSNVTQIPN